MVGGVVGGGVVFLKFKLYGIEDGEGIGQFDIKNLGKVLYLFFFLVYVFVDVVFGYLVLQYFVYLGGVEEDQG